MGVAYRPASEARRIAEYQIAEFSEFLEIQDCGVRIEYVFRSEPKRHGGKVTWGTCSKVGGRNAWLSMNGAPSEDYMEPKDVAYYVLEFAETIWNILEPVQREALVHHELSHIHIEAIEEGDGGYTLKTKSHDVEEFAGTVKRYGQWAPDLTFFVKATGDALHLFNPDTGEVPA